MSDTGPYEGTLQINPLLKHASSYIMLRPFFRPSSTKPDDLNSWELDTDYLAIFAGSVPGTAQELNTKTLPHLQLEHSMIHIPAVSPGDYAVWHCMCCSRR